ncbi:hypothetical protein DNTS_001124 [Danionella cerebrum]|uniref:LRRCT domain-containing protein n=1 Tax=Danionella cerebrum TaxID=2873325 RepID=A0A553QUN1_9TELE|nr:hypothetical protein DNTS_001124 [Danionella translucida]
MVLNNESFPVPLEHLTHLYLSGCQVEELGYMAFKNLPQLHLLDLSDNNILQLNSEPWRKDNKIEILNLSNALYNHSYIVSLSNTLKHNLPKVLHLNLSNNDLVFLPEGIIAGLPLLTILDLRNNSLVSFRNITFGNTALEKLDLRDNAFKNLPNATLLELSSIPDLHVSLSGNPWRCDCDIEDMLIWLERHTFIDDRLNLSCAEPKNRRNTPLVHLEHSYLPCWSDVDVLDRALEPSYVFLGLVLALIGVIFLLVLYLNRKGIKRWMYNIRDACRDHMEGYHYRYENSTDPRLANFNLNSDV